jgi:hypothetical protein
VETERHVDAILEDLRTGADAEDEVAAERLLRGLAPAIRLRLLDVVGELALELSDQIPGGHVEVRLAGRDAQLLFVPEAGQGDTPWGVFDDEGTARLTLRMPEGLKGRVEAAAADEGLSVNAWLVRTVGWGLDGGSRRRRSGSRLTGFAQS